jgi:hypothetical protein
LFKSKVVCNRRARSTLTLCALPLVKMRPNCLTIFVLLLGCNLAAAQNRKVDERHTSEFRYVFLSNEVGGYDKPTRTVSVLLDETSFSENTLVKLFSLVSKRFPEPQRLEVRVSTSLWQLATPEEADMPVISERDDDPHDDLHPRALLLRQDGNELLRYTPKAPYINMKTVILKGRDPYAPSKR